MAGFDRRHVQHAFSRAAARYDDSAWLQREIGQRLAESLDYVEDPVLFEGQVDTVIDLGSGTGVESRLLQQRFPQATVFAVDAAMGMLKHSIEAPSWAEKLRKWVKPQRNPIAIQADARALPFADHSVDLIFSNLCLQWIEDPKDVLNGFRRVLKPGGALIFSTFGPMTLHELRHAFAMADGESPHVSPFADIQHWGDALIATGFRNPVLDRDVMIEKHLDFKGLLQSLKAIGATNAMQERRRTLTGKRRFDAAREVYDQWRDPRDGQLPVTWEAVYALAWAPPVDAPIRQHGVDEVRIPASSIGIRRRGDR